MNGKAFRLLSASFLFLFLGLPIVAGDQAKPKGKPASDQPPQLSEKQKKRRQRALERELNRYQNKWIGEDVLYIITDEERQAFKRLVTDQINKQSITPTATFTLQ